uniref:ATP synthase peripheral stalk subunit OSCP, mitochondrial n=2 Tax=Parascaris univalens TaxID=6257 RepID=A0A915C5L5_PARUN
FEGSESESSVGERVETMVGMLLKRSLSLSAVAQQLIRAPIQVHGIEGRYASALYSAAYKQKKLDIVHKDFTAVGEVYKTDPKFREFVQDPALKPASRKAGIETYARKLGVCKEVENFLVLMAENGRLKKLNAIMKTFESIMRAHHGELFAEVTTAEPLSKAHEKSLNEALQKFAKPGQKLNVSILVDPAILGGLIVNINDRYVDMSIASRIKKYEQALLTAV